jgi:hypothetical protein
MGTPGAQGDGSEHGRGGRLRKIIRPAGTRAPFSRATAQPDAHAGNRLNDKSTEVK